MIAINPTPPWEPINVPTPNLAELEATVAAVERLAYQAQLYVAATHAARARAFTEEARQVLAAMSEESWTALRSDWQGAIAMGRLDLQAGRVVRLAWQARREVTTYQRRRARLEVTASAIGAKQQQTEKGA